MKREPHLSLERPSGRPVSLLTIAIHPLGKQGSSWESPLGSMARFSVPTTAISLSSSTKHDWPWPRPALT